MSGVIFALALALLFFILGIFLFCGKGSFLIAGFNTATAEEKQKYNQKKLCRAVSIVCLVCAVMLCIMAYLGYRVETGAMKEADMLGFAFAFVFIVVMSVVLSSIYISRFCKK